MIKKRPHDIQKVIARSRHSCSRIAVVFNAVTIVTAILICLSTTSSSALSQPTDVSAVFGRVRASLAIIATSDGTGTGFCVSSTRDSAYYVTDLHVVENESKVAVIRQYPTYSKLEGTVVARGSFRQDTDLAVVRVRAGNVPVLKVRMSRSSAGEPVAIAGYPSAQFTLEHIGYGLEASVHVGTIAGLPDNGRLLEYDAQTLPGNSGGPIFSPTTGQVLGVVRSKVRGTTEVNLATSSALVLIPFLLGNNIVLAQSSAPDRRRVEEAPPMASVTAVIPKPSSVMPSLAPCPEATAVAESSDARFSGRVSTIDLNSKPYSVTVDGPNARTMQINDFVTISKDNLASRLDAIQVGDFVTLFVRGNGTIGFIQATTCP